MTTTTTTPTETPAMSDIFTTWEITSECTCYDDPFYVADYCNANEIDESEYYCDGYNEQLDIDNFAELLSDKYYSTTQTNVIAVTYNYGWSNSFGAVDLPVDETETWYETLTPDSEWTLRYDATDNTISVSDHDGTSTFTLIPSVYTHELLGVIARKRGNDFMHRIKHDDAVQAYYLAKQCDALDLLPYSDETPNEYIW